MAAIDLTAYIEKWSLDDDIATRLRRLTPEALCLVTQKDLADVLKPSAMLNMRCNRFEKAAPVPPAKMVCEECEPETAVAAKRTRDRSDKRRANRANKEARLDRLLDSILTPCAGEPEVAASLLDMLQPLRSTGAPSEGRLDWVGMGATCDPFRVAPRLADTPCGKRKREHIEAFAWLLEQAILPRVRATRADGSSSSSPPCCPTIVDAGCSTGSLILPLAHAFPDVRFVGIDVKASSLALLRARAAAAGLSDRVSTWEGRIEEYDGRCDALISLHACGGASDAALQLAARYAPAGTRAAPFAVSPCCVGALPFGIRSLGGRKEGSGARGASSAWLCGHLLRTAASEGRRRNRTSEDGPAQHEEEGCTTTSAHLEAELTTSAHLEAELFALLAASAGSDGSASQGQAAGDGAACARQRRAKRVIEIDRLAAMPGHGLGGVMLRLSGEATAATSSLTDVLVGPPGALRGVVCA